MRVEEATKKIVEKTAMPEAIMEEEPVTYNHPAMRVDTWGFRIKTYPFTHACTKCGHREMIGGDGKMFVEMYPMGSTKKCMIEGGRKKRVDNKKTGLNESEVY